MIKNLNSILIITFVVDGDYPVKFYHHYLDLSYAIGFWC